MFDWLIVHLEMEGFRLWLTGKFCHRYKRGDDIITLDYLRGTARWGV